MGQQERSHKIFNFSHKKGAVCIKNFCSSAYPVVSFLSLALYFSFFYSFIYSTAHLLTHTHTLCYHILSLTYNLFTLTIADIVSSISLVLWANPIYNHDVRLFQCGKL